MIHRLTVRGVIVSALAFCSAAASAAQPVASVPELDLSRYAGQWHEIAHLPMFFQRQCVGDITARYSLDAPASCHNPGGGYLEASFRPPASTRLTPLICLATSTALSFCA